MLICIPHFVFLGIFVVFEVQGELKYSSETCQRAFDNEGSYTSKAGQELGEDDPFSIVMLCFHNWYREAANLDLVSWNSNLAKFAAEWAAVLKKDKQCGLMHSTFQDRQNKDKTGISGIIGENLAMSGISTGIKANRILEYGKKAVVGWFNEIQYYKFGGESESFNKCKMTGTTGHFTQVMWQSSTEIGCAYDVCGKKIVVVCNYFDVGNMLNDPAFKDDNFCALNKKLSSLEAPVDSMGTCSDFDEC
ncbi:uncharacterized protein LOC142349455 [Convolutriloba macropyga]|uniref:uncharacterized protein LOC142349455 n=1 Tax=Convolutriloba macropyga TaxID=536237 RepID=UPI003F526B66